MHNCEAVVYLDANKAIKDGIQFFRTANGSIVSQVIYGHIHSKYIVSIYEIENQCPISCDHWCVKAAGTDTSIESTDIGDANTYEGACHAWFENGPEPTVLNCHTGCLTLS